MSRSDCVPLPTPGAPTSIIRAACLSFLDAVAKVIVDVRYWVYVVSWVARARAAPRRLGQVPIMSGRMMAIRMNGERKM